MPKKGVSTCTKEVVFLMYEPSISSIFTISISQRGEQHKGCFGEWFPPVFILSFVVAERAVCLILVPPRDIFWWEV